MMIWVQTYVKCGQMRYEYNFMTMPPQPRCSAAKNRALIGQKTFIDSLNLNLRQLSF